MALVGLALLGVAAAAGEHVFYNGIVHTADAAMLGATAFAVDAESGRFLFVGSDAQVRQRFPAPAASTDLRGQTVVPGLADGHVHMFELGISLTQAALEGCRSPAEMVERLLPFADELPPGAWLLARGWDQEEFDDPRFPTKEDLDGAFPDIPVWLRRTDGHAKLANSKAMSFVEIPDEDPAGGSIVRDANGEPTGVFIDNAMFPIDAVVPPFTKEQRLEALRLAIAESQRWGLTSVHDAGLDYESLEIMEELADIGPLGLRIYAMVEGGINDASGNALERWCERGPLVHPGEELRVRSVKLFVDGALGSRGAALLEPYSDDPGNYGLMRVSFEELLEETVAWTNCGFQVNPHAIGDAAVRRTLEAFEAAKRLVDRPEDLVRLRPRVEHAQIIDPADFQRFVDSSILASMQPIHASSDYSYAEDRLGADRLEGSYAWRRMLNMSIPMAFGSDFPVEPVNPLLGFQAAVDPPGDWLAEQRLSRQEALYAFTQAAAYFAFEENEFGSITAGKLADFVVYGEDIMAIDAARLSDIEPISTWVGGVCVYDRDMDEVLAF